MSSCSDIQLGSTLPSTLSFGVSHLHDTSRLKPDGDIGATLAATGSATTFSSLAAARFFLGVFESCLNPGFVLITSSWWKREEQSARIGLWYCANGLIGAPSGLIFWAIAHMRVSNANVYSQTNG
jgi:MFS family permease